jgi:hypothetical protein
LEGEPITGIILTADHLFVNETLFDPAILGKTRKPLISPGDLEFNPAKTERSNAEPNNGHGRNVE